MSTAPVLSSTLPSSSTRTMAPEASRPLMCAESATPDRGAGAGLAARRGGCRDRLAASPMARSTVSRHSAEAVGARSAGRRTTGRPGPACCGGAARSDRCRAARRSRRAAARRRRSPAARRSRERRRSAACWCRRPGRGACTCGNAIGPGTASAARSRARRGCRRRRRRRRAAARSRARPACRRASRRSSCGSRTDGARAPISKSSSR